MRFHSEPGVCLLIFPIDKSRILHLLCLVLLFSCAVFLRIYLLDKEDLSISEFKIYDLSSGILQIKDYDGNFCAIYHSPVTYIFFAVWLKIFPDTVFCMRLFSVVFSVMTVLLAYPLSRLFLSRWQSIAVTILFCFSTYHIYFSRQLSGYSLLLFLVLVNQYSFFYMIKKGAGRRILSVYVISCILAVYTQLYILVFVFAQYCILKFFPIDRNRISLRRWCKAVLVVLAVSVPLYLFSVLSLRKNMLLPVAGFDLSCFIAIARDILCGYRANRQNDNSYAYLFLFPVLLYFFLKGVFIFKREKKSFGIIMHNWFLFYCLLFIGFGILFPFFLATVGVLDCNEAIYICVIYNVCAVIGAGLAGYKYSITAVVIITFVAAVNTAQFFKNESIIENPPYKECALWLKNTVQDNDLIVTNCSHDMKILHYYGLGNINMINYEKPVDAYYLNIISSGYKTMWVVDTDLLPADSTKTGFDRYYPRKITKDFINAQGRRISIFRYSLK